MKIICLLGGTGFVGSAIVRQLSDAGYLVKVLTRNCSKGKHLLALKNVQIIECNALNDTSIKQCIKGASAVINLVGILHETKQHSFDAIHADLPQRLVKICKGLGIPRFIHMSALQASETAPSQYLKSKAKGEKFILAYAQNLNITIFKPSIIFGQCDNFINLFAKLIKVLPVILLAKPNAKFQPIFVEDVAHAFVKAIEEKRTYGAIYELAGPKIYSLRELLSLVANTLKKRRLVLGLNDTLSYIQATMMELLPIKLMTRDNLRSMQVDSVSQQAFPDFLDFEPSKLETILPTYIKG